VKSSVDGGDDRENGGVVSAGIDLGGTDVSLERKREGKDKGRGEVLKKSSTFPKTRFVKRIAKGRNV